MTVPFGFSAGDIVPLIKLSKDLRKALKDSGGASDEYCRVLQEFEGTSGVLLQLSGTESSGSDEPRRIAIREQSQLSQLFVADFISKLSRYEKTLGHRSKSDFRHGALDKMRWATSLSEEAKKVKEDIQFQGLRLNLLLGIENRDACSQLKQSQKDIKHIHGDLKNSISAETSAFKDAMSQSTQSLLELQISCSQQANQVQKALSTHQSALASQLANIQSSVCREILTRTDVLSHEMRCVCSALMDLERFFSTLAEKELQSRIRQETPEHGSTTVDQGSKGLPTLHDASLFSEPSRLPLGAPVRVQPSTRNLLAALSRSFADDVAWTYHTVTAKFFCLFKILLCFWPQLKLLFRLLRKIPRSVTLLLEDNISFEDALGGHCSLQFQYFKHWDVFEKMLHHQFQSKPGYSKVSEGEYRLYKFNERTCDLNSTNWYRLIRPGMKVLMSIKVPDLGKEPEICPLCNVATNDKGAAWSRCVSCDVEFSELARRQGAEASQGITAEGDSSLILSDWRIFKRIDVCFLGTRAAKKPDQEPWGQATPDDTTMVEYGNKGEGGGWIVRGQSFCCREYEIMYECGAVHACQKCIPH